MSFIHQLLEKINLSDSDNILIADSEDGNRWKRVEKQNMAGAIGLGNVDNTSDADKPISNATQDEIDHINAIIGAGTVVNITEDYFTQASTRIIRVYGTADLTITADQISVGQVIVIHHLGFGHVTISGSGSFILTPATGKRLALNGYGSTATISVDSLTSGNVSGDLQEADDIYDIVEPDIDLDSSINFNPRPSSNGDIFSVNVRKGSGRIATIQADNEQLNSSNSTRLVEEDGWDAPLFDARKFGTNFGIFSGIEMKFKETMDGPFTILFVGHSRTANVRRHVSHRINGVNSALIGAGSAFQAPNQDKFQWLINSTDGNLSSFILGNVIPPAGLEALEAPPSPILVGGVFDGANSQLWVNGVLMRAGTLAENELDEIIVGGAASPLCRRLLIWNSNQSANLTAISAAILAKHPNISSYVA